MIKRRYPADANRAVRTVTKSAALAAMITAAALMSGCGSSQAEQSTVAQEEVTVASEAAQAMSDLINGSESSLAGAKEGAEAAAESEMQKEAETEAAEAEQDAAAGDASEGAAEVYDISVPEDPETEEDVFKLMSGWNFEFASGAGGWQTSLEVSPDGSFSGMYHDSDMGDTGEGYEENGTRYHAEFTGRFSDAEKVGPRVFRVRVEDLKYETEPDTVEIADGTREVATDAYGLSGTDTVLVYLPGVEVASLPEKYMSWVGMTQFNHIINGEFIADVPK